MGLTSALYTGLSGLNVNQTQIQVVGNNIANANTTAFKSSRALFEPQFYVTDSPGSPPDGNSGGTNPSQSGLGAVVGSIQQSFTQGAITPTGNTNDMAIDGNGFFVVQGATQQFTRDGTFNLNSQKQLVTNAGEFVQGFGADSQGNVIPGKLQNLAIPLGETSSAKATTSVSLEGNLAADGALSAGGTQINSQDLTSAAGTPTGTTLLTDLTSASTGAPAFTNGQTLTLNAQHDSSSLSPQTFTVGPATTVSDLQNFFNGSLGINTSTGAGTSLVAGTAPNSAQLQITGNSGIANALTVATAGFADASGNTPLLLATSNTAVPTGESVTTNMTVYDSLGSPVHVNMTASLQTKSNAGTTWSFQATSDGNLNSADPNNTLIGTGTVSFDSNGQLTASTGTELAIHRDGTGAQPVMQMNLDFSGMSSLTESGSLSGSQMDVTSQNGYQLGTLDSFSVGTDGKITGAFTNGQTRTMGQLAMATFSNDQGLTANGSNLFSAGANSGVPVISTAQNLGAGSIRSGSLEQSNTDLSNEFVNLITASTGFSASSKVITTSNQMLTDLLNSTR